MMLNPLNDRVTHCCPALAAVRGEIVPNQSGIPVQPNLKFGLFTYIMRDYPPKRETLVTFSPRGTRHTREETSCTKKPGNHWFNVLVKALQMFPNEPAQDITILTKCATDMN